MESRKRKQILEDSTSESESESNDETQSKKRKHIIEDSSSEEQIQSYDGTDIETEVLEEFLREYKKEEDQRKGCCTGDEGSWAAINRRMSVVNLGSEGDPLFQEQTEQSSVNNPANSMLILEEESVSDPAQQKMIVVRIETHSESEPLDIEFELWDVRSMERRRFDKAKSSSQRLPKVITGHT
ncbi:uncharacterized protein DS421_4g115160 [Arachis hypogaea]|nr:uncharacterized protein DS421_4g115160 [Arachis hypogaea]